MAKMTAILAVAAPEAPISSNQLRVHTYSQMSGEDVKSCISRPRVDFQSILQTVSIGPNKPCTKFLSSTWMCCQISSHLPCLAV